VEALTVILPTYNERENLEYLVPQILEGEWPFPDDALRVIIVDDQSSDNTSELIKEIQKSDKRVILKVRADKPSLPQSIWEGIQAAETDFVAWLDADGSMPISDLIRFARITHLEELDVLIGSRFVFGGGYKGLNVVGKTSLLQFYRNIKMSQDSILAVVLSRALNEFLRLVLRTGIRDLTSGFLISRKSLISPRDFDAVYGDYCPILIRRLIYRGAAIREVGYTCLPRQFGISKTGASLPTYLRRGFPYIWGALREIFVTRQKGS
jgi:dolichol-phosphate mannosyltransferase